METELVNGEGWPLVALNDDGIRPGGYADQCFYCHVAVGHPHRPDCVIVNKKIKMRFIFEVEIDAPHYWTKDNAEFHYGESSWCADNALDVLEKHKADGKCLCSIFDAEFIEVSDPSPRRKLKTAEQVQGDVEVRAEHRAKYPSIYGSGSQALA